MQPRAYVHALHGQVATQEAYSAGDTAVVKCSLLKQYELAKSGAAPDDCCKPGNEATILRGLIGISLKSLESKAEHQRMGQGEQEQGAAAADAAAPAPKTPAAGKDRSHLGPAVGSYVEISGYFNQASRRLLEVGAAGFFGDDDVRSALPASSCLLTSKCHSGSAACHDLLHHYVLALRVRLRNLEWFAATAWNTGREAGLAGDCMSSAVLFGACADFYAAHPTKDSSNLGKQKVRRFVQGDAMPSWLGQGHVSMEVNNARFLSGRLPDGCERNS